MIFQRGDARMTTHVNPTPFERFVVALPPVLHDKFPLEVCDRQCDRNLFFAEHLIKEAIVALHRRRYPAPADAKQKETDPARCVQPPDQLSRFLDRAHVPVRPSLRFLQPDSVPEPDCRCTELELVLCRRESACDAIGRDFSDVPSREEVDERAFTDAGFPKENDVDVLSGSTARGERVVDDEIADESLAFVAAPRDWGVRVVREGGDAGVSSERHVEVRQGVRVGVPPFVHGGKDVTGVGFAFKLSDDCDDGGVWGDTVAEREDGVVGLLHAVRHPPTTFKTEDEEVHARTPTEFGEERLQRVLRVSGGGVSGAVTQAGGVPETECLRFQEVPVMIACAYSDGTHVTCRNSAVCADHEVNERAFPDASFAHDDNIAGELE